MSSSMSEAEWDRQNLMDHTLQIIKVISLIFSDFMYVMDCYFCNILVNSIRSDGENGFRISVTKLVIH